MGLPPVKVFFLIKPGKSQILNKQKFYPFPHPNFPNLPKPNNLSCASDIPIHRPDMYRQTDQICTDKQTAYMLSLARLGRPIVVPARRATFPRKVLIAV